jgi:peptide deformylase
VKRTIVTTDAKNWFQHRHGVLAEKARPVVDFGQELHQLIEDLLDTAMSHDISVGIAAPQIGVSEAVAIVMPDRDDPLVIVNPSIANVWGKKDTKRESCLSLPPWGGQVERRTKLTLDYQDADGRQHQLQAEGFLARVIQHEVDHLNGRLYTEHMGSARELESQVLFDNYDPKGDDQ